MDPQVTQLETFYRTMCRAGSKLLEESMWQQWASRFESDEKIEEHRRLKEQLNQEYSDASSGLTSLLRELREASPASVQQWALAHCRLLKAFVAEGEANGIDPTAISVAQQQQQEWMRVHDGLQDFAEINDFYVNLDAEIYQKEFGLTL